MAKQDAVMKLIIWYLIVSKKQIYFDSVITGPSPQWP